MSDAEMSDAELIMRLKALRRGGYSLFQAAADRLAAQAQEIERRTSEYNATFVMYTAANEATRFHAERAEAAEARVRELEREPDQSLENERDALLAERADLIAERDRLKTHLASEAERDLLQARVRELEKVPRNTKMLTYAEIDDIRTAAAKAERDRVACAMELTPLATERKRIRQIVIRHTVRHFWIGEGILFDMDAASC